MFSSTSGMAFRRPGGAEPGRESPSALRVMPATGDPTDEVRASLASLTARAQRLVSEKEAEPLLRNGFGLYEASRRGAEEARQRASKCQSTSEGYAPATHASVELFMTQHLGFDAQAQQRLLQQLQQRHAQLGTDLGPIDAIPTTESTGFMGIADVDAVVAELKNDILLDVQHAVHRRQTSMVRDQVDSLFKATWHPYYLRVADDYEALFMNANELITGKGVINGRSSPKDVTATSSANLTGGTSGAGSGVSSLSSILNSGSALAAELNRRVTAFASIVEGHAAPQWILHFNAYVTDADVDVADELAVLWATVRQILEPIQRRGSDANILSYVASSRAVMERKSLAQLLERVLRVDPGRTEELENMSGTRLMEIISRYCSTTNHWMHVFVAMRVGRYDVAKRAAEAVGIVSVCNALEKVAAVGPTERHTLLPPMDLQAVYAETATKEDPYRQAVLLILLAGRTGESPSVVLRNLLNLLRCVTDSLEDALWVRLACIRGVDEAAQVTPVQSLRTLQRAVLDDMQDLVSLTQGNVCRLASFLIHAQLPSTGLRLLLENNCTHIDGFHMALCFHTQNLLQGGLHSTLEAPIDLARHMSRYCSVVLLNVDRRSRAAALAGTALFSYFFKCGLSDAFVEFALKDTICARLLGPRNAVGGQDALLLRSGGGPLSEELLKALIQVAEAASVHGEAAKATHVLLAVVFVAGELHRPQLQERALQRAVQIMSPALAQALHLPPHGTVALDILSQASQLQQTVRIHSSHGESKATGLQDYETFAQLCRMADVYAFVVNGNLSDAVETFLQLSFVPPPNATIMGGTEHYVDAYCNSTGIIQLGASAVLPLAVSAARQLLERYAQGRLSSAEAAEKHDHLLECMQVVCAWARLCCGRTNSLYPPDLVDFERVYLS